ncbi:MAG: molybdopterin molybdotransferase MoeA, partial [Clostridia bacterium]|nr:molybdopterin molybdotransferase MoeA [Clostridia bacterium]
MTGKPEKAAVPRQGQAHIQADLPSVLANASWTEARDLLLRHASPTETESVPLAACAGRVLAFDLRAGSDVPPFDRSAYDGYALRSADVAQASPEHPVTLSVTETIPAGKVAALPVTSGHAAHLMTGAAIPDGADCVIMFEKTRFTETGVTLSAPLRPGENIVRRGEDITAGSLLAPCGTCIDAGLAGTLAAQGIGQVRVYRKPVIGLVSTGSEITEVGEVLEPGKIYNANRAGLTALLEREGCLVRYLGLSGDNAAAISELIARGIRECDAVVLTGGVSVGDWDVTPEAMLRAGVTLLVRGVSMKPGMACAYGTAVGRPVIGLSGNPASAVTNFCACVLPAVRRLCGRKDVLPQPVMASLVCGFLKESPADRFLRGQLVLEDGAVRFAAAPEQGNAVLSSTIGCRAFLIIPAGSPPVPAGGAFSGFMI